jgi:hypothetical protein
MKPVLLIFLKRTPFPDNRCHLYFATLFFVVFAWNKTFLAVTGVQLSLYPGNVIIRSLHTYLNNNVDLAGVLLIRLHSGPESSCGAAALHQQDKGGNQARISRWSHGRLFVTNCP